MSDPEDDPFISKPQAMMDLAQRSFARAVAEAIAENDRLGIPSSYGQDGKVFFRQPPAKQADYIMPPSSPEPSPPGADGATVPVTQEAEPS